MKQILAITFAATLATTPITAPLQAQEQDPAQDPAQNPQDENDMGEGLRMLQQGTRLLLEGLMQELGPVLLELEGKIVDMSLYYLPEVLPNGDIIIRRRVPLVVEPPLADETEI